MASCDNPGMWSLEAAIDRLLASIAILPRVESVPLWEAAGRVLYRDVLSPCDLPAFDNSAMDGYALRAEEGIPGNRLRVAGAAFAGHPLLADAGAGACVRIFTGAPVPAGCDAVVIQENVAREGDEALLCIDRPAKPGDNIRRRGEELPAGACLLAGGTRLRPADAGLLASVGLAEAEVYARPRVAFLSTGDELRTPGESRQPGEIYESNRYVMHALLRAAGMEPVDLGIVPDEPRVVREVLQEGARTCDAVLPMGGASVGEADYLADAIRDIGRVDFWKVAIKPGKPFLSGVIGSTPVMGLPGNPVSMMVTFQQLVRPALMKMAGLNAGQPVRLRAVCQTAIRKSPGRMEFLRGRFAWEGESLAVSAFPQQGSHRLTSMSHSNCFVILGRECEGVAHGEMVEIEPFDLALT